MNKYRYSKEDIRNFHINGRKRKEKKDAEER